MKHVNPFVIYLLHLACVGEGSTINVMFYILYGVWLVNNVLCFDLKRISGFNQHKLDTLNLQELNKLSI